MANELKSLTLNGKKYDSFVDQTARGNGGTSAEGTVLYTEQTLTEEQKAQARQNIGAVGEGGITREMLADYVKQPGKNLLDPSNIEPGNYSASGAEIESTSYSRTKEPIAVSGGTTLSFQAYSANETLLRTIRHIFAYDSDGNIVDHAEFTETYTVPQVATHIKFSTNAIYVVEGSQPMLFEGTEVTNYVAHSASGGESFLNIPVKLSSAIDYDELLKTIDQNSYLFRTVSPICDSYVCTGDEIVMPDSNRNESDVYNLYDGLMESHPQYITRTLLGNIDKYDTPIYRYDFAPPLPLNSKMDDVCKILYLGGTHGGEAPAIAVGFRFFKELCENWRNSDLLKALRFNCHFTVIPLVNPYGYANTKKTNQNGVNLNRNFTKGWKYVEDDGTSSSDYSGETPASEVNTQLIEAMCNSERFDFGIDHHIFGPLEVNGEKGKSGFFVTTLDRPHDVSFANMVSVWANAKTVTEDESITDISKSHYQVSLNTYNGYVYGAFENGVLWESMTQWGNADAEAAKPSQEFNTEMLAAIMYTAFTEYHRY